MIFRFTLDNTIEGAKIISEPLGWKDIKVKLKRDEKYHSLVEIIDVPIIFYRANNQIDGGYDYIRNIEDTQGINAIIEILIEVKEDEDDAFDEFFTGTLELATLKDISDSEFYKLECNIIRNDFWSKFVNRKSTPVDLQASTDLDGNSRSSVGKLNLPLPSQKIRSRFTRDSGFEIQSSGPTSVPGSGLSYLIWSNANFVIDEVQDRFEYGIQISSIDPTDVSKYIYKVKYDGSYTFTSTIKYQIIFNGSLNADVEWFFDVRRSGVLSSTQIGTTSSVAGATEIFDNGTEILNETVQLLAGDEVYIYGTLNVSTNATATYLPDYIAVGVPFYTTLAVVADTTFPSTQTESFILGDAAESILSRIIGRDNCLYSDYLDSGCGLYFAIMKGLHLRGYTFTEKPFSMSFDDWWEGSDPILNLGLGYEVIGGVEYIRIEQKADFYNPTPSLNLNNVEKITRSYDPQKIYKSGEFGYAKWSAESESGVDDPQTKITFATNFELIGVPLKMLSKFVAASLAIEQTRRNQKEKGKDWRMDEDIFIINVSSDSTPSRPLTDDEFDSITGLLNAETRYNTILSAKRCMLRWANVLLGSLQSYLTSTIRFVDGEGNYDMASDYDCAGGCSDLAIICDSVTEKANLSLSTHAGTIGYIHRPEVYDFVHDITWAEYKTIRDNRKNAIGVSQSTTGHESVFIDELEFDHYNAKVTVKGWLR